MLKLGKYENLLKYFGQIEKGDSIEYQSKYPELYVDNDYEYEEITNKKICYLTFDDGPYAANTTKILDTLKKYDAHATFFVVYNDTEDGRALLKRMAKEGHTIGVHTASHDYEKIYSSVDEYLNDFEKVSNWIEEVIGKKPEIFRFPGGSINSYNIGNYQSIISEMLRRGYTYYDWNCDSGDAAASYITKANIVKNVSNTGNVDNKIVLMHDGQGHGETAKAVGPIIKRLKKSGYEFRALDKTVKPARFDY